MANHLTKPEEEEQRSALETGLAAGAQAAEQQGITKNKLIQAAESKGITGLTEKDINPKIEALVQRQTAKNVARAQTLRGGQDELFEEARKKKGLSTAEKLSLGLVALLPGLIGFGVGGARAGQIATAAGAQAAQVGLGVIQKERAAERGVLARQAAAVGTQAGALEASGLRIEEAGFKEQLRALGGTTGVPKGQPFNLSVKDPLTNQSKIIGAIQTDRGIRDLAGNIIPPETLKGAVKLGSVSQRPRIDPESGFLTVVDPNAPGGLRILGKASKQEIDQNRVARGLTPITEDEFRSLPAQRTPEEPAKTQQQTMLEKLEAGERLVFPDSLEPLPSLRPEFDPEIRRLNSELEGAQVSLNTGLLPGESPKQRDVRVKDAEKAVADVRNDIDKREVDFIKRENAAAAAQAAARGMNRRLIGIFNLKDVVDTGPIAEIRGRVLDIFNTTTSEERVRLRGDTQRVLSNFIKSISGAAVTEQEAQRLERTIATMDKNDVAFRSALDGFAREIEFIRKEKLEATRIFEAPGAAVPPSGLPAGPQQKSTDELLRRRQELLQKQGQ